MPYDLTNLICMQMLKTKLLLLLSKKKYHKIRGQEGDN